MTAAYPDLRLVVSQHTIKAGLDRLTAGDLDVLLTRPPVHDEAIEESWLLDEDLAVALPADHSLSQQAVVALDELDTSLIMPSATDAPGAHVVLQSICQQHDLMPDTSPEVADIPSLLLLVGSSH